VDAVTAALVNAYDQPMQAAQMGARNRARIEREASRRGQMDAMWRLYLKLLLPIVPRSQRPRAAQR
jgi:hypothetical protein